MDIFKKLVLASIGAIEMTKEKVEELFDDMVKRGEITEDERAAAVKKFVEKTSDGADKLKDKIEDLFARCAEKCAAKVSDQLAALGRRVGELEDRMKDLEKKPAKK